MADPATERAEHTKEPVSSFLTVVIVSVPSDCTAIRPLWPGNIKAWLPSFVQKTAGAGIPLVKQSKETSALITTRWSCGGTINVGRVWTVTVAEPIVVEPIVFYRNMFIHYSPTKSHYFSYLFVILISHIFLFDLLSQVLTCFLLLSWIIYYSLNRLFGCLKSYKVKFWPLLDRCRFPHRLS